MVRETDGRPHNRIHTAPPNNIQCLSTYLLSSLPFLPCSCLRKYLLPYIYVYTLHTLLPHIQIHEIPWLKQATRRRWPSFLVISRSDISIRETETCWSARRPRRRWWNKMGSAVAATTRIYSPSSCVVIVGLNWALGNSRLPATGIEEQERASVRHWLVVAGQGY